MAIDPEALVQVRRAAAEFGEQVLRYPNVIGYGVGQKTTRGRKTGVPSLVVYVQRKLPASALRADETLPREVVSHHGTLLIDVIEQPLPQLGVDNSEYRPLRGGCRISPASGGSGTLGAVMYDGDDATVVLLTCNHVLTAAGQRMTLPANTAVAQPDISDTIGNAKRIVPWFPTPLGDHGAAMQARVDAGIVSVDIGINALFRVIDLGKHPHIPLPPYEGLEVSKRGFTTELTTGTVEQVDVTVVLTDFDGKRVRIGGPGSGFSVRAREDENFFLRGDSGSLAVDVDGGAARGLLFGGDMTPGGLSFGCQLSAIMEELNLETPCTGSMNAAFMASLRRRRMFAAVGNAELKEGKHMAKFRLRYLKAAADGSVGSALEHVFQSLAHEFSEALAIDDDFAGLLDLALGDLLVQPTVYDMLEYRLPEGFGDRLGRAFDRLGELNPDATGYEWVKQAFGTCEGNRMRDVLAGAAPGSATTAKRPRKAGKAVAR